MSPATRQQMKAERLIAAEMVADLKAIGRNIRIERRRLGYSLQRMGNEIGCSWQMLGHVERATYKPSWELYWALVKYFKKGAMPLSR